MGKLTKVIFAISWGPELLPESCDIFPCGSEKADGLQVAAWVIHSASVCTMQPVFKVYVIALLELTIHHANL